MSKLTHMKMLESYHTNIRVMKFVLKQQLIFGVERKLYYEQDQDINRDTVMGPPNVSKITNVR